MWVNNRLRLLNKDYFIMDLSMTEVTDFSGEYDKNFHHIDGMCCLLLKIYLLDFII